MSRITLKDKHFRIVGYYEPKTNQTKDSHFRIVAHGDILSSLIHDAAG